MNSLKALVGLMFVMTCAAAQADGADQTGEAWHINLHTVSHHFSERQHGKKWNEENLGLGLRREFSNDFSVQAGFYRNSIDRWSTYAIGEYTPLTFGNLHSGV